jgi:hypothetical protein
VVHAIEIISVEPKEIDLKRVVVGEGRAAGAVPFIVEN